VKPATRTSFAPRVGSATFTGYLDHRLPDRPGSLASRPAHVLAEISPHQTTEFICDPAHNQTDNEPSCRLSVTRSSNNSIIFDRFRLAPMKKFFSPSEQAARNSLFLTTLRSFPFIFSGLEELIKSTRRKSGL
jgi:hypothetical protein